MCSGSAFLTPSLTLVFTPGLLAVLGFLAYYFTVMSGLESLFPVFLGLLPLIFTPDLKS